MQRGTFVPHAREDLHHITKVALHDALLGAGVVSRQCTHSDAVFKHFDIWDEVGDPGGVWGDGDL